MPPTKKKMPKQFKTAMAAFPKIVARKKAAFLEKKETQRFRADGAKAGRADKCKT